MLLMEQCLQRLIRQMTVQRQECIHRKKLFGHVIGYNSKTKMGIESTENYYLLSETDNIFDQISNDLTGDKQRDIMCIQHWIQPCRRQHIRHLAVTKVL